MPGIYRPRHPERTVLYRVLFHHFERFVAAYQERFEKAYGYFRPIIKDAVEKYLDCGNPRCGFARIRCPRCRTEHLLMFSCKTRGFVPSCHAKRLEEWGEWVRETLLLDVPHRQVVFTIPKMLRVFFKFKRKLLGEICRCAVQALLFYFQAADRIIDHLKLVFVAEKPPPSHVLTEVALMAAEQRMEYFL